MKIAIIMAGIPWNTSLQRHHKVAMWLKKMGYEVYFIEKITSSKFSITKAIKKMFQILRNKNITNINNPTNGINVVSYKFINPEFEFYNKRIIKKITKKIPTKVDLIINYLPIETTEILIDKLKYKHLIYDCVRDFKNWGGYGKNIKNIEIDLSNKSDIILTDSYYITDKMRKKFPEKKIVQLLPTFEQFQKKFSPKHINKIKRITYFGQLGEHINTKILKKLSDNGYEINIFGDISVKLEFNYNYYGFFSEKKKMFEMIMEKSDAIIIPYKGNMNGVIPAKMFESLATFKPVYVSSFYDSNVLKKYIYVFENYDNLEYMIKNFNYNEFQEKILNIKKLLNKEESFDQERIFMKEILEL